MQEKLFDEFEIPSAEDWIVALNKELKGRDFREVLRWITEDGIEILPFYTDVPEATPSEPGTFPYLRGFKKSDNTWEVNQEIVIGDNFVTANKTALTALENGASSVTFNGKIEVRDDLDILLKGIEIAYIEIHFRNTENPLLVAELLKSYCERNNIEFNNLHGSIVFDPFTSAIKNGGWQNGEKEDQEMVIRLFQFLREVPSFHSITVDATVFHNAGATPCQELAFAIAAGAEYINLLLNEGIISNEAVRKIQFRFSAGVDIYQEICKLRAFRVLWSNVIDCLAPETWISSSYSLYVETSGLYSARKDHYTNLLRSTTSVFAAVCGGCKGVTVLPFDNNSSPLNFFAARMSRNIQLIIQNESGLDKIADPAGGSYFIEHLTKKMTEKSWDIFIEAENNNGFLSSIKNGYIQEIISREANRKKEDFLNGKLKMTGVNVYPNPFEKYETLNPVTKVKQDEIPVLHELEFENEITVKQ